MNTILIPQKRQPKSKKAIDTMLKQIEKIVDDKLATQKVFTPILLTVVTSVIAFLFVHNLGGDVNTIQMNFMVFGYALLCFTILIISLFGQSDYDAKVKKTKKTFQPHRLSSYCYLSDEEYMCKLIKYAGRSLTYEETLSAKCIKQKINEYAVKKGWLNIALGIVLAGVLLLGIVCLVGVFALPTLPQYGGGTT